MRRVLVLFLFVAAVSSTKPGCPISLDIKPCVCTNGPFTYLQCKHLDDVEVLKSVFENSTHYKYKEVHIEFSTMQYLPSEIFEKVPITELHLKNVTLAQLFDKPPSNLKGLDTLHIENTRINRGMSWKLLDPMIHLRILNIYYNSIKTLGTDFSEHLTKRLKQFTLYETGTKSVKPGVFKEFVDLEKVAVISCKLTELSRDIFPTPSNIQVLYFNNNNIKSLPDDMFADMPRLQTLGLRHNQLTVLPATAFIGSTDRLVYFQLEGNPIICDCRLSWLIKAKPDALSGTCALPSKYKGREIKELDAANFKC